MPSVPVQVLSAKGALWMIAWNHAQASGVDCNGRPRTYTTGLFVWKGISGFPPNDIHIDVSIEGIVSTMVLNSVSFNASCADVVSPRLSMNSLSTWPLLLQEMIYHNHPTPNPGPVEVDLIRELDAHFAALHIAVLARQLGDRREAREIITIAGRLASERLPALERVGAR